MILLAGYIGLATDIAGNRPVEVKGEDYARSMIAWAGHPIVDIIPATVGIAVPEHGIIRTAAIYDNPRQGRCICWFRLTPPLLEIPVGGLRYWPGQDVSITLDFRVQLAVSAARSGQHVDLLINEGNSFGSANGMPVVAGCRLAIEPATGRLVPNAVAMKAAEAARRTAGSG